MATEGTDERLIVSYLKLRRVLGSLGAGLPFLLALWGFALGEGIQESISDYYSLRTRDAFVGILFAMAWFLFTYRGYEHKDNIAGYLGCLFALGVALFPNSDPGWEKIVHFISAAGLFLVFSFFSLVLFTKGRDLQTPQKKKRNRIYRTCGAVILVCIALIPLYNWLLVETAISALQPVFWLESFALVAFGFSWIVKGKTLWKDAVG